MVENDQLDGETIDKLVIVLKKAMAKMAMAIRESKAIETLKSIETFNKQKEKQAKGEFKHCGFTLHTDSLKKADSF